MTSVLATALLFVVTGWSIVRRLDRAAATLPRLAQAFLAGALLQSVTFHALSAAGVPWTRSLLLIAPLLAGPLAWLRVRAHTTTQRRPSLGWIELAPIILVALLHALFATIAPLSEWDFLGIWGIKGKVFFEHRGIDWAFLERPDFAFTNPDYPPLLPVTYAISALVRGAWEDRFIGLFTTLFGLAAAVVACDGVGLRRAAHLLRLPAAFTIALVAFSDRVGLAEGPLIAFSIAGLLRIREAVTTNARGPMLLGALFIGGAAWTKNEGLALLVAVFAGLAAAGAFRQMGRLWPAVVLAGTWQLARAVHELPTLRARGDVLERVTVHLEQFREWAPQLRLALQKPWFWIAVGVALALCGARALYRERFLVTVLVAQLCAIGAAYLISHVDLPAELAFSWERITHQLALIAASTALLAWASRAAPPSALPTRER